MTKIKCFILLALTIFVVACAGCDKNNDITGKWQNINLPETVEFNKDRTGLFNVQNSPSLPFTWKKLEDGRIALDIAFQGSTRTLYGRMEKNSFVLTGRGEQAIYRKTE